MVRTLPPPPSPRAPAAAFIWLGTAIGAVLGAWAMVAAVLFDVAGLARAIGESGWPAIWRVAAFGTAALAGAGMAALAILLFGRERDEGNGGGPGGGRRIPVPVRVRRRP